MTTDHSLKVKQFRKSSQHSHSVWHGVFVTTDHSESWHGQEAEVDLVGFRCLSVQTMKIHNSPCGQFKPVLSAWVELTLSLPRCYLKMTNKSVRCQILKPFFLSFFASAIERIFIKMHTVETQLLLYRMGKYAVCRHVHALFNLEILQAGAVRGLNSLVFKSLSSAVHSLSPSPT